MWTPASTVLDEPIIVLFWEYQDFQIILVTPFLLQIALGPFLAFGGTVLAGILIYLLKRGKPSGALLHLLHSWELFPCGPWGKLPGVLSPHPQRYGAW